MSNDGIVGHPSQAPFVLRLCELLATAMVRMVVVMVIVMVMVVVRMVVVVMVIVEFFMVVVSVLEQSCCCWDGAFGDNSSMYLT